jgi:hypothetical protein
MLPHDDATGQFDSTYAYASFVPSGEKERFTGVPLNEPPFEVRTSFGVAMRRSTRPSLAMTTIWLVSTAAIVPSSACVGECQPPPSVSWTLPEPSGCDTATLPPSMKTSESALATGAAQARARPASKVERRASLVMGGPYERPRDPRVGVSPKSPDR